ncbi:MAG: tRNA preQ1(34) S-adenosylmethionine ribosyltransferase-isomerase QueA [Anaerolineaceae bacterium]|nr:tRNA preQ1(34) S-adenosylmethionine ribosyltransferase-isomerase QueA [Anaerolineaceae bacterium]
MKTNDFYYELPPERIAQTPVEPRHSSRLLVLDRKSRESIHTTFWNILDFLQPNDLLVINQTRVIPARLAAHKLSGGKAEILLLRRLDERTWIALVGGTRLTAGKKVQIDGGPECEIIEVLDGARRIVRFPEPIDQQLDQVGEMPLPPYIHERLDDPDRYQTVYATESGSAAAPTAGLHFTPELMEKVREKGIEFAGVMLHVGLDTFAPVTEENVEEHAIHTEWCELSEATAAKIEAVKRRGGRVIAVGTTSVRTLETAGREAQGSGQIVKPFAGSTDLFILPGYEFKVVDAMITNFHLPKSTLLMLVSAFAGKEFIFDAYCEAVQCEYRFFSFGDAMLIQ